MKCSWININYEANHFLKMFPGRGEIFNEFKHLTEKVTAVASFYSCSGPPHNAHGCVVLFTGWFHRCIRPEHSDASLMHRWNQPVNKTTHPTPLQRSTKLKNSHLYFWSVSLPTSRLHLLSKTSWASVFLRNFFTHIHLMRRLSSMVNLIAVTTLLPMSGLRRC